MLDEWPPHLTLNRAVVDHDTQLVGGDPEWPPELEDCCEDVREGLWRLKQVCSVQPLGSLVAVCRCRDSLLTGRAAASRAQTRAWPTGE